MLTCSPRLLLANTRRRDLNTRAGLPTQSWQEGRRFTLFPWSWVRELRVTFIVLEQSFPVSMAVDSPSRRASSLVIPRVDPALVDRAICFWGWPRCSTLGKGSGLGKVSCGIPFRFFQGSRKFFPVSQLSSSHCGTDDSQCGNGVELMRRPVSTGQGSRLLLSSGELEYYIFGHAMPANLPPLQPWVAILIRRMLSGEEAET